MLLECFERKRVLLHFRDLLMCRDETKSHPYTFFYLGKDRNFGMWDQVSKMRLHNVRQSSGEGTSLIPRKSTDLQRKSMEIAYLFSISSLKAKCDSNFFWSVPSKWHRATN